MRRWNWQIPAIVLGGVLVLVAGAYFAYESLTEMRPDYGGRYVEGIAGSPMALNPLIAQFNESDRDTVSLIFSGLTRLGPDGEVVPDLAERWDIAADGKTYTFRLRDGARWHDGVPVNPEDVVQTVKFVQSKDYPGSPDLAALWKDVTVTKKDDRTIEFTLPQPFAPFLTSTTLGLVPFHLLRDVKPADLTRADFNTTPIGSGPYRLTEAYIDRMVLRANPDYVHGRPFISELELRFFPSDQAVLNALEEKRIDGALLRPVAPNERLAAMKADERVRVLTPIRTAYTAVFLNAGFPLFQDKAVRQALLYGADRQAIVRDVLAGQAEIAHSPVVPNTWAASDGVVKYDYDPEKAAQLLATAGWKAGPEGILQKAGKDLRFTLVTNDDPARGRIAEMLAASWKKLGVRMDLSSMGPADLIQKHLSPRQYEAALYGLDTGYDPDAYPLWHSSQHGENALNISRYANKLVDTKLEEARQTSDVAARRRLYGEFQATFAEDAPALLLYYPRYSYVLDRKVQGVEVGALYETSSRFFGIRNWYILTKRVLKR